MNKNQRAMILLAGIHSTPLVSARFFDEMNSALEMLNTSDGNEFFEESGNIPRAAWNRLNNAEAEIREPRVHIFERKPAALTPRAQAKGFRNR